MTDLVLVGVVSGVRGLKGDLRIKPFTSNAEDMFSYGPLFNEDASQTYKGRIIGHAKGQLLARLSGVADRTAAEAIKGLKLFVPRSALPETGEDEFYYAELIGLRAELVDGSELGTVLWVLDAGAGTSLELETANGPVLVPFTKASVPLVDIAGGRVVIDPPDGLLEPAEPEGDPDGPFAERDAGI